MIDQNEIRDGSLISVYIDRWESGFIAKILKIKEFKPIYNGEESVVMVVKTIMSSNGTPSGKPFNYHAGFNDITVLIY